MNIGSSYTQPVLSPSNSITVENKIVTKNVNDKQKYSESEFKYDKEKKKRKNENHEKREKKNYEKSKSKKSKSKKEKTYKDDNKHEKKKKKRKFNEVVLSNVSDEIEVDDNYNDSSSEWSSDDDNDKIKNTFTSESMITYNDNNLKSNVKNDNRNIIYLPDGKILVTAKKNIIENPNNIFIPNNNEIEVDGGKNFGGVNWGTDHSKDRDLNLHGLYRLDVSNYSLFTGNVSTHSNARTCSTNTNISSFQLFKKSLKLPSGATFSDDRNIFRPLKKPDDMQMIKKSKIYADIRLKKSNRYFVAGKYDINHVNNANKKKKKMIKKGFEAINGVFVKRVRYDNVKRNKNKGIENKKKTENLSENYVSIHDSNMGINNSIITINSNIISSYSNISSVSGFGSGSGFVPLPPVSPGDIDKEFESDGGEEERGDVISGFLEGISSSGE